MLFQDSPDCSSLRPSTKGSKAAIDLGCYPRLVASHARSPSSTPVCAFYTVEYGRWAWGRDGS